MKMKFFRIANVNEFFKVIYRCKGKVELVSQDGDRINLKSKLSQYLSLAKMFSNGYIKELELITYDTDDTKYLLTYMYQNKSI